MSGSMLLKKVSTSLMAMEILIFKTISSICASKYSVIFKRSLTGHSYSRMLVHIWLFHMAHKAGTDFMQTQISMVGNHRMRLRKGKERNCRKLFPGMTRGHLAGGRSTSTMMPVPKQPKHRHSFLSSMGAR